jgi:hypothetical protein
VRTIECSVETRQCDRNLAAERSTAADEARHHDRLDRGVPDAHREERPGERGRTFGAALSTCIALLGRTAIYTGREATWEGDIGIAV